MKAKYVLFPWEFLGLILTALVVAQCSDESGGWSHPDYENSTWNDIDDTYNDSGSSSEKDTQYNDTYTGDGSDSVCASKSYESKLTKQPSDIVFILDNSGSMDLEAKWVQENMNEFSRQIAASGVDYRVIVISSYPNNENGICIAPPLGSGGCPTRDSKPPTFTHVNQKVESTNGLTLFLATYPLWMGVLRPDSAKHIVMVTDDNSALNAILFDLAASNLKPAFRDYKFHGIFCYTDCSSAASVGTVYKDLVRRTGGVSGDLCEQNFTPVFNKLATAVVQQSKISCKIPIPAAPAGMQVDPEKLSIEVVTSPGGQAEEIPHVAGLNQCGGRGWYYDNNTKPTKIILCPNTCNWLQTFTDAQLSIDTGCFVPVW
jgi:hypothetical protein